MKTDKQLLDWLCRNYEALYSELEKAKFDKNGLLIIASYLYIRHVRTL